MDGRFASAVRVTAWIARAGRVPATRRTAMRGSPSGSASRGSSAAPLPLATSAAATTASFARWRIDGANPASRQSRSVMSFQPRPRGPLIHVASRELGQADCATAPPRGRVIRGQRE